jgi:hypothetical protein
VTRRGVGAVRLAAGSGALVTRGGLPLGRSVRFCVTGGGQVHAALDRRDRAVLVGTTARGHRAVRGVAPGRPTRTVRRALPGRVRVARGVFRSGRTLVAVRGRRVLWVAVTKLRRPAAIRAAIRGAGL